MTIVSCDVRPASAASVAVISAASYSGSGQLGRPWATNATRSDLAGLEIGDEPSSSPLASPVSVSACS